MFGERAEFVHLSRKLIENAEEVGFLPLDRTATEATVNVVGRGVVGQIAGNTAREVKVLFAHQPPIVIDIVGAERNAQAVGIRLVLHHVVEPIHVNATAVGKQGRIDADSARLTGISAVNGIDAVGRVGHILPSRGVDDAAVNRRHVLGHGRRDTGGKGKG